MEYLSQSIADFYVKRNIIEADKKELYKCGVSLILNDILTFSIVIILSALLGNIRFSFEFLITFCFTRVFCGGFHARKTYICRFTMLLTFSLTVLISFALRNTKPEVLCIILAAAFVILLPLIPVKHPNKELGEEDIKKNRKKGIISFVLFSLTSVFVHQLFSKQGGIIIALSLAAVTVLAIIGTITNGRSENNEEAYR